MPRGKVLSSQTSPNAANPPKWGNESRNIQGTHNHPSLPPTSSDPPAKAAKFGMYIMFPIGWMYYFGTNLESRFSVPDFWPAPETTHKIPFEREELDQMAEQLKAERLERRRRRLEQARVEMKEGASDGMRGVEQSEDAERARRVEVSRGTFGRGAIEKWARGQA